MKRNQDQQIQQHQQSTTLFKKAQNGIDIAFKDISYKVKIQQNKKKTLNLPCGRRYTQKMLLKNVSGIFKAGRISAIMGASGAGKTTLLNILACRIHHQSNGHLFANNIEYTYQMFGDFANYVMQSDLLMQTLTVRETLMFATNLKIHASKEEKIERVRILAEQLKLQNCLDTLVGGVIIKGISGGQKKRTSIAFELISDPQVLFMDEPTSGLDSLTSYIIVSYLKRLARKANKTVIMTIHQPNSQTYQKIDDLIVMVQGKIIYQGEAQAVKKYFTDNFSLNCPRFINPPDFFMSKIHHQNQQNVRRYPQYFDSYDQHIKPQVMQSIQSRLQLDIEFRKHQASKADIYGALIHRNNLNVIRNPMLIKAKLLQGIFLSLFAGGIFFGAGKGDFQNQNDWNYLTGCLFFVAINALTTTLSPVTITFPLQRPVFLKQQDSKMYTVLQYSIARFVTDLPQLIIITLINVTILYFMIGLSNTAQQYFIFLLNYFLLGLAGASLGLLIGSVILDAKSVAVVVPIILLPLMLFSGYFKNRNDYPAWIGWIEYISPIKYGFTVFVLNEVKFTDSLVDELQFDLGLWASIFILLGLGMAYRLLSIIFLYALRSKSQ